MPSNSPHHKTCSRCAASFECRPEDITHCDCQKIDLSFEETQFIAAQFKDCVCHKCLSELKQCYYTSQKPKAIFSWSGGKDSAYCLHKVLSENTFDIRYLLTSVNSTFRRISMHGVREELLEAQANSIGIPLLKAEVSEGTNEEYERQMSEILLKAKQEGIEHVIFGDIFLEDLRAYREENLAKVGMKAVFPLWKADTNTLVRKFIDQKFKTIVCCTNDAYLDDAWVGREINENFLNELPANVDPCGEHGEYHTFCYAGPVFKKNIAICAGEKVYRPLEIKTTDSSEIPATKGFWFIDLFFKES